MEVEHHVKACTKKTVLRIVSANRKLLEKPPSLSKGDRPDLGAAEAAKTKKKRRPYGIQTSFHGG